MDDLLPKLLAFPPHPPPPNPLSDSSYEEGIKHQIQIVGKIPEKNLILQTSGGESALDVINPALNTVPYIQILLAHINAFQKGSKVIDFQKLYGKIDAFLETFDQRQIRYLGQEFTSVIDAAATLARRNNQPWLAISPIRNAILRLDPSGSVLTSAHLLLVKLALESRAYDAAVAVLDKFILHFPPSSNQSTPKYVCELGLSPAAYITQKSGLTYKYKPIDVMEYFFNSGIVYIGLRKWEKALECLENAVTYPTKDAVSKVMVEAYKKWLLVGVLLEGKAPNLPKTTSSTTAKAYHILAKPYETIASIFETGTASRLKAEVEYGQQVWQGDCNTGLILCVLSAYQKFQIRDLGNIYTKISIPEIINLTMSAETGARLTSSLAMESLIRDMTQDGILHATMSNAPGQPAVLTFTPSSTIMTEAQMQSELAALTARIHDLAREIKQTDRMLTHDKDYITFAKKQKKNEKTVMQDQGIGGSDMEWNAVEDEELMSGVF